MKNKFLSMLEFFISIAIALCGFEFVKIDVSAMTVPSIMRAMREQRLFLPMDTLYLQDTLLGSEKEYDFLQTFEKDPMMHNFLSALPEGFVSPDSIALVFLIFHIKTFDFSKDALGGEDFKPMLIAKLLSFRDKKEYYRDRYVAKIFESHFHISIVKDLKAGRKAKRKFEKFFPVRRVLFDMCY